jgi:hypothetical protein
MWNFHNSKKDTNIIIRNNHIYIGKATIPINKNIIIKLIINNKNIIIPHNIYCFIFNKIGYIFLIYI